MTYWLINLVFLAITAVVAVLALLRASRPVNWWVLGVPRLVILAATALFDNIMIGVGLVGYDESKIGGWFVGIAPLEDFAYAVAAVILLPALWRLLERPTVAAATGPAANGAVR